MRALLVSLVGCAIVSAPAHAAAVQVGSKVFTESVVLGEIATQALRASQLTATHRRELGGTRILWSALLRGDIDCYPEYTGTLRAEIFANQALQSDAQLRGALQSSGVWASPPLGFNNTYVLGMRRERARELGIARISQLSDHPQLRFGFSNEFLQRADGWPGVQRRYALGASAASGLTHELAYRALAAGELDVTDLYSTDPEIAYYDLMALEDDRAFFPEYQALFICREEVSEPVRVALSGLGGRITPAAMARLNARAKLQRVPENAIASEFIRETLGASGNVRTQTRTMRIWQRTREHLAMVGISLLSAIAVAIPLGVFAFQAPRFGRIIFLIASVVQTLPALALLVFLIPWWGIGYAPAIVALFLYALLPIVRNTHTGLADIPGDIRESAQAMGLSDWARLRYVELPLASRSIVGGIKTAAVISVGTATLGALIGAGGYGQPILTGIRLDDMQMILEGAIPAAVLALSVQGAFGALERVLHR